jgi:phosphoribosylformimino-5-aminoimidazole carboxamide ribotide isomerase
MFALHEYDCISLPEVAGVRNIAEKFQSAAVPGENMVTKKRSKAQSRSSNYKLNLNIRRSAVSLAVAAALPGAQMMPNFALAQDSGDDRIEEIVTIGVRSSILNSVETKRLGDSIADVVDAGALGTLPDASIADALGRVPGVTTIRDSGQSSELNIRGMNGDFIQTTLNGREQASTAGYSAGTRWLTFDQYPVELINQAAVYKSPKSSQLEGGVAGIVDLRTVNPLEAPKEHNFVLTGRLSHNDAASNFGGDEDGYRASASYQGKFANDTFGIAAGVSYLDQPNAFIMSRAGADDSDSVGYGGDGTPGNEYFPRAFQWQAGTGTDERLGAMATLVWEPTDKIRAQFDYFLSDFERKDERKGLTASGFRESAAANNNYTNQVINGGVVTSASISPVNPAIYDGDRNHAWFEARTEDQTTEADSDTYGLTLEWHFTDSSTVVFDGYHSGGTKTRVDRIATMHAYEFDQNGPGTFQEIPGQVMTYQLNGTGFATADFSGVDFTDISSMRLGRYERYPHEYTDEIDAFTVDFRQDLEWGWISSLEAGVRVSDREFAAERGTWQYGGREGLFDNGGGDSWCEANDTVYGSNPIACMPLSVDGYVAVQSLPGVPDHFAITDIQGLGNAVFGAGNDAPLDTFQDSWTFINDTTLTEKTEAIYLMFNLDFTLGNMPVRGNIGVRYVQSDVKSAGLRDVGAGNGVSITDDRGVTQDNLAYVSSGPEYSDTLPALNLAFELTDNDVLRFAAAKVMSRPPVGNMTSASGSWSGANIPGQGIEYNVWNDGSPFLDPFRADQIDLSYEHYFEDGGLVSAAVFWKDIESLVEGPTQFTGVDPDSVGVVLPPGTFLNIYQTWINNDKGGYIRGIELAATGTFDSLPGIWGGLGASGSYSFTESETEITGGSIIGNNTILPLPGLSENVWSITVFWDIEDFSAHVNTRYRDEYIQRIPIPGSTAPVYAEPYTTVDAQMSYNWPEQGISIVLSGNNLTDEEAVSSYAVGGTLGEIRQFGRQYYFGVNYQF